jgi:hypothetical protein
MLRVRFKVNGEDYRPITWPIKHPYWCTGYDSDGMAILVAYVDNKEDVFSLWPDACELDVMEHSEHCKFSERFPKPDWFEEGS